MHHRWRYISLQCCVYNWHFIFIKEFLNHIISFISISGSSQTNLTTNSDNFVTTPSENVTKITYNQELSSLAVPETFNLSANIEPSHIENQTDAEKILRSKNNKGIRRKKRRRSRKKIRGKILKINQLELNLNITQ